MSVIKAENLFRLNILTGDNPRESFQFCLSKNIVGAGYKLNMSGEGPKPISLNDYEERYEQWLKSQDGKLDKSFHRMINAMKRMKKDDLIWTREPWSSNYYLCRVISDWQYVDDEDNDIGYTHNDIHNVHRVEFLKMDLASVPGSVIDSFTRGGTIQRVHSKPAMEMTKILYNEKTCSEDKYEVNDIELNKIFDLLNPVDVEELISLYLQAEKGYYIYSSTNKLTTGEIECEFVKNDGSHRGFMQVKTGSIPLNPADFKQYTDNGNMVFLFSSTPVDDDLKGPNVEVLDNETILNFMRIHEDILPGRIKGWMKVVKRN